MYTSWKDRNLRGWRLGIFTGIILAASVFLINITIAIFAIVQLHGHVDQNNQIELFEGDCEYVRKLNIGAHVVINFLSTALLGASNYAMQCLSAPTRSEIDAAHSDGGWLDIGVLSVRNLRKISKTRALLWSFIGLSSLPLHLL
jgi:hypothetical protein